MAAEPQEGDILCRRLHTLKPKKITKRDRYCDECDEEIEQNSEVLHCGKCDYDMCGDCQKKYPIRRAAFLSRPPQIVFSAHGDTCFSESDCLFVPGSGDALYFGQMDNFAGVHAMMSAYFSGKLPKGRTQCKVTYGEEEGDFEGAREVIYGLNRHDFVVVIDVTGVCPRQVNVETVSGAPQMIGHVLFEKVKRNACVLGMLSKLPGRLIAIDGVPQDSPPLSDASPPPSYTYEIWHECNDPQADEDESDIYRSTQQNVVFLGVTTTGGQWEEMESSGDYNEEAVFCWKRDIEAVRDVVVDLSRVFVESYVYVEGQKKRKEGGRRK